MESSFSFRKFTSDAKKKKKDKIFPKSKFAPSIANEKKFLRQLMKVARTSGYIVERYINGARLTDSRLMMSELQEYARLITPWAETQSKILVKETIRRINSDKSYRDHSRKIGKLLTDELFEREIEKISKAVFKEQVGLFKSIPIEAGERAQKLALEAVSGAGRADEVALELSKTTSVTESRARTIARTEVARTNSVLNEARAVSVGSEWYIWRNSGDEAVRHAHEWYKGKKLDGQRFRWDKPPKLEDGTTGHPGTFPNCRCYAEAVFE